jgi:hypothetical protein
MPKGKDCLPSQNVSDKASSAFDTAQDAGRQKFAAWGRIGGRASWAQVKMAVSRMPSI